MSEQQPTVGAVTLDGTYTAAQLDAALADPELLARALAWAGLTVTRLDAERLRVAATDVTAVVRARVAEQRYELTFDEEAPEAGPARAPVTQALKFQARSSDAAEAVRWTATLEPLPPEAGAAARRWLPKMLLALPHQLDAQRAPASEPAIKGRWVWIVAFIVLLLALGLAV